MRTTSFSWSLTRSSPANVETRLANCLRKFRATGHLATMFHDSHLDLVYNSRRQAKSDRGSGQAFAHLFCDLWTRSLGKDVVMLIYEALEKDHLKVKSLIGELIEAGDRNEKRRVKLLIEEIRDELIPHSRAEESVFYNVIGSAGRNEAQPLVLHHGYQEHIDAEALLRTLHAKDEIDAEWKLLARKFQKAIAEHIHEEETEIFEMARTVLSDQDAEMMATAFEELKPHVHKEGWIQNTLDLVVGLMPPKYAATLRTMAIKPDQIIKPLLQ